MKDILKSFYSVLKSSDKFLSFGFLTGVTKFSQVSIFSDVYTYADEYERPALVARFSKALKSGDVELFMNSIKIFFAACYGKIISIMLRSYNNGDEDQIK